MVYTLDIKLCATAYIKAESLEEAQRLADLHFCLGWSWELPQGAIASDVNQPGLAVTDCQLDSPRLPTVSISPVVSTFGPFDDSCAVQPHDSEVSQ